MNAFNPIIVSGIFTHEKKCALSFPSVWRNIPLWRCFWTRSAKNFPLRKVPRRHTTCCSEVKMLLAFAFLMFSVSNFIYDPFGLWLHSKMHERITPEVDLWLSQEAEWKSKNLIFHCSRTLCGPAACHDRRFCWAAPLAAQVIGSKSGASI